MLRTENLVLIVEGMRMFEGAGGPDVNEVVLTQSHKRVLAHRHCENESLREETNRANKEACGTY